MIDQWFFVFAVIVTLLIPGPTNALLASSAYQQGIYKTSLFIPAEFLGYVYAMSLWALFIHLCHPIWPYLLDILHVASAIYVFWLAFHLWKASHLRVHNQKNTSIRPKQLFFVTLKNPKAVLFAVGIFPQNTWESVENCFWTYLVFLAVLVPTSLFWMFFGKAILDNKSTQSKADVLYKGSALLLMIGVLPVIFKFFMIA